MNYALVGRGRMGRAVDDVAGERGHVRVAAADGRAPAGHGPRLEAPALGGAEVAFEFTGPESAEGNVVALLDAGVAVVCGTTGWSRGPELVRAVAEARRGLIVAPNFSVGVHLFFRLVAAAGHLFGGAGFHAPFVHEVHHRGKRDVPSGTARRLAAILLESDPRPRRVVEGHATAGLPDDALPVVGLRIGHEPGTHVVGFDGAEDVITLTHRARDRRGFALGAVLAAEWLLDAGPGLHEFDEVLDAWLARRGGRGERA